MRNISDQTYFDLNGPNIKTKWTYMSLTQAALAKFFPDLDTIMTLDIDTLVYDDISDLWRYPYEKYYFMAVPEPEMSKRIGICYYNCGVTFWNLKKVREDRVDDEMIRRLNTKQYNYVNQDAEIECCRGHIYPLPYIYNVCQFTGQYGDVRIRHFCLEGREWFDTDPIAKMYRKPYLPVTPKQEAVEK